MISPTPVITPSYGIFISFQSPFYRLPLVQVRKRYFHLIAVLFFQWHAVFLLMLLFKLIVHSITSYVLYHSLNNFHSSCNYSQQNVTFIFYILTLYLIIKKRYRTNTMLSAITLFYYLLCLGILHFSNCSIVDFSSFCLFLK